VRLDRFIAAREPAWTELEDLVGRAGNKPERLGVQGVLRMGALYRRAAADLSLARRAFPGDPVEARLERLVLRSRQLVYGDTVRSAVVSFFVTTYWRRVAERPAALAVAAALMFVPMALAAVWALDDPAAALGLVPQEYQSVTEPGDGPGTLSTSEQAALSSEIFTNNIRVSLLAIAGGVLLGLGTAFVVVYNGSFIGALGGIVSGNGNAEPFFELVVPHGVLELSLIVVTAAAGLRLGWALVEPGPRSRWDSARREARPAMTVVLGTIPWFVLAGLVEGFVTGSLPGLGAAITVGVALGLIYWALVLWRGVIGGRAPSPADTR
jgi:uncharacterized membrane protein SpoIIM required for sporulation